MAAGYLVIPPWFPARNRSGRRVSGALFTVYENGTADTKAEIYADSDMVTPLANPVEADSSGNFPAIFAEAGTADEPVLYRVTISGPNGESIVNPGALDDWQPSLDADTAALVMSSNFADAAEESAAQAAASLADALAIQAMGDDAAAIATRAAKDANGSDFTDPVAVTQNIQFQRDATDTVAKPVNLNLSSYAIKAWSEFALTMDGTDKAANLTAAITAALTEGRELWIDADDEDGVPISTSQVIRGLNTLPYQAAFRRGLVIRGVGRGGAVFNSSVANGALFDIAPSDDFTAFNGMLGGSISGITILQSGTETASDGIRLRSVFQFDVSDTHVIGLTGTAYRIICSAGDKDGSNQVTMHRNRAENCATWGYDFEATAPNNEISHLTTVACVASGCGVDQSVAITGITKANPAVVTAAGHGLQNGDRVYLLGVGGMTEVDSFVTDTSYVVANRTSTTFQLTGINSTGYTTFTSGGRVVPFALTSGGWKWRGQKWNAINCGGVQNYNANLWLPGGSGLSQDFDCDFASENPLSGFGILIQGARNGEFGKPHLYSNQSFGGPNHAGILIDATTSTVRNITIDHPMIRATAAETNYRALKVMGTQVSRNTIRWEDPDYKQFDFAGQKRVVGLPFDSCPMECELLGVSGTALRLRPSARGNRYPLKAAENSTVFGGTRSTTGEVRVRRLEATGITLANTGLAISTVFNIYITDATQSLGRDALEASTTAPVQDTSGGSGRWIKTGDDTRTWVGRWATDAAGEWLTGTQNWLNPEWTAGAWYWTDSSGKLRTKSTLPTSDTDGTVVGSQS